MGKSPMSFFADITENREPVIPFFIIEMPKAGRNFPGKHCSVTGPDM